MEFERIEVVTRDEYRDAQEPVAFDWEGTHYEIVQIIDRWYEGYMDSRRMPLRYFRVRAHEGRQFILRYHELFTALRLLLPRDDADE